jgi:hypothetical protein
MLYPLRTNDETQIFIEKYLDEKGYPTKNPTHIEVMWKEINEDFESPGVNPEDIATYIQLYLSKKNYWKFRPTLYWTIIADWVKLIAGFTCLFYNDHNLKLDPNIVLTAHHPNYDIHGYELQNIHTLICLCQPCHDKCHANAPASMREYEERMPIIIYNEDIFKTPLITEKYIGYQLTVLNYLVDTVKFRIKV